LKGKDRSETLENITIMFIFAGALVLSFGILISIFTETMAAIVSMAGAWVALISTVVLILTWAVKEYRSD
jgi:hypothetical protein